MSNTHTGKWYLHDDDCWCGNQCNRGGHTWTCCGATVEDSECSGSKLHPTNPSHPLSRQTISGHDAAGWATHISNEAIRKLSPESFE